MNAEDDDLGLVLRGARTILLGFDGPVCSVFAGYPAPVIARVLRGHLLGHDVPLSNRLRIEDDPLELLRFAGNLDQPELLDDMEELLRVAELEAAKTSAPTPGAIAVLAACRATGRDVAVVSNNSQPAIQAYLVTHHLDRTVSTVIGRSQARPELMKPNPWPILQAIDSLRADPDQCILIGDSMADIYAAHAAGIPFIGYANLGGKARRFAESHADATVTTMHDLAAAVRATPLPN